MAHLQRRTRPVRYGRIAGCVYVAIAAGGIGKSLATPQFARATKLPCMSCHTHVPRLNEFGQRFFASGFSIAGHTAKVNSAPWVQLAAHGSTQDGSNVIPVDYDDTLIGTEGHIGSLSTILHALYTPTTNEWEINVLQPLGNRLAVQVGRLSPLSQYDPGLDLTLSTPAFLAPADLSGESAVGPFGPANSITGSRVVLSDSNAMPFGDGWKLAATVPQTIGSDEAATEGSTWQPRGVFLEAYNRSGLNSFGLNTFAGRDGRHYYGAIAQRRFGRVYVEAGASASYWSGQSVSAYSASIDWTPAFSHAFGIRVDSLGPQTSYVPFASWIMPGHENLVKIQAECQIMAGSSPSTSVEASFRF